MALQEAGASLSAAGVAGLILTCCLPTWRVTAFVGSHLVVMQVFWEGLWMTCVSEYTGRLQCKLYDALLDLPAELQAARGLVCAALVLGCLAFLLFLLGARCTNCLRRPNAKARLARAAGALFCLAALAAAAAVSWTAGRVVRDFHDPRVPQPLKRELGSAVYVGFLAAGLLLCGGAALCASCPPPRGAAAAAAAGPGRARYSRAGSRPHASYAVKDYV